MLLLRRGSWSTECRYSSVKLSINIAVKVGHGFNDPSWHERMYNELSVV